MNQVDISQQNIYLMLGAIQVLRNAMGGVSFPGKKRYEGVMFNVINVKRGWVGVKFPGKKHYITLEWPLTEQNNKPYTNT